MLTIYSICRGLASHQIEFPSVFSPSGESLVMGCGGYAFKEGVDYTVLGEVREVGGARVLAVIYAAETSNQAYLAHVCGYASADGSVEGGFRYFREGRFGGLLFAVDAEGVIYLRGDSPDGRAASPTPAPNKATPAEPQADSSGVSGVERDLSPDAVKAGNLPSTVSTEKAEVSSFKKEVKTSSVSSSESSLGKTEENPSATDQKPPENLPQFAWSRSGGADSSAKGQPQDDAGEGELIPGTGIRVRKGDGEDFPTAGPIPELAGVRRSELARKAEARKKTNKSAPVVVPSTPAVSSSGMRLGKESGGDNASRVGQNKIDESELW
jgi:hypothetical protein